MLPRKLSTFLIAFLALACDAFADVQLPGIISDHMLLQRDMPVRIFGKAQPDEAVSVAFRGQTVQTVTDAVGRWEVWLQPLKPGPASEMTIRGANVITVVVRCPHVIDLLHARGFQRVDNAAEQVWLDELR